MRQHAYRFEKPSLHRAPVPHSTPWVSPACSAARRRQVGSGRQRTRRGRCSTRWSGWVPTWRGWAARWRRRGRRRRQSWPARTRWVLPNGCMQCRPGEQKGPSPSAQLPDLGDSKGASVAFFSSQHSRCSSLPWHRGHTHRGHGCCAYLLLLLPLPLNLCRRSRRASGPSGRCGGRWIRWVLLRPLCCLRSSDARKRVSAPWAWPQQPSAQQPASKEASGHPLAGAPPSLPTWAAPSSACSHHPPSLQVLADLRRQQREAADSAELAAAREARLRGELAEVRWAPIRDLMGWAAPGMALKGMVCAGVERQRAPVAVRRTAPRNWFVPMARALGFPPSPGGPCRR